MYYSRNGGCLFALIVFMLVFFVFSFFTRLLFTPVGMTIALVLVGYSYFTNKSRKSVQNDNSEPEVEMENKRDFNRNESEEITDDEFSRDAEDIEFKNID
ncbi:hypothetical protein QUF55_03140 [Clostridiaceae bacterium HSG29]|nr:hypothetical protein [Clostridiaceae bacterium HSG29]